MSAFEQAVKLIVNQHLKSFNMTLLSAEVKNVRANDMDVIIPGQAEIKKVRLTSILDSVQNSFKVYPKVGSVVVIGILEFDQAQAVLIASSEVDEVEVLQDGAELIVKNGRIRVKNSSGNLRDELTEALKRIKDAVILTPSGPGNMRVDDKNYINERINKIEQILF